MEISNSIVNIADDTILKELKMKEPTEPKDFESRILEILDSNIRLIQVI